MAVVYGESPNYGIQYHEDGSDLSQDVFEQAAQRTDEIVHDRELDILQIARDLYVSPHVDQDGVPNLDVPLEASIVSLRDALFSQVTSFADALPDPTNLTVSSVSGTSSIAGGTYYYAVAARTSLRRSSVSSEVSVEAADGDEITLSWNEVDTAEEYVVYRGTSPGVYTQDQTAATASLTDDGTGWSAATPVYSAIGSFGTTLPVKTTAQFTTGQTVAVVDTAVFTPPRISSLVANGAGTLAAGDYKYRITAYDGYRESVPSTQFTVTVDGSQAAVISWVPTNDATLYRIYREDGGGNEVRVVTTAGALSGGILSYTDTGDTEASEPPQVRYIKHFTTLASIDSEELTLTLTSAAPTHLYRNSTLVLGMREQSVTVSGTATVTDGTTSVTVNHGLPETPNISDISVTPTNSLGSASKFWISDVTSTTFKINVNTNPGSSTATFVWSARYNP